MLHNAMALTGLLYFRLCLHTSLLCFTPAGFTGRSLVLRRCASCSRLKTACSWSESPSATPETTCCASASRVMSSITGLFIRTTSSPSTTGSISTTSWTWWRWDVQLTTETLFYIIKVLLGWLNPLLGSSSWRSFFAKIWKECETNTKNEF